jgi:copper homeostasis protein
MVADVATAVRLGAASVVIGVLTADGEIDVEASKRMIDAAEGRPVTYSRAFDLVADQFEALDSLLDLEIARILTSGGELTAAAGTTRIAELVRRAGDRLVVMPGSGITPVNAATIVRATGVREIHFSARKPVNAPAPHRDPNSMVAGAPIPRGTTSSGTVAATVAAVADL